MIRIALAEDNDFLAKTLAEKVELFDDLHLKFRAENGERMVELIPDHQPIDVILMDIQMPVMDGIEATEKIKQLYPQIKIIMVTVFDDEENIFKAIQAGADGYLLKDESAKKMHEGIREIMNGGAPMSASIALKALRLLRNPIQQTAEEKKEYALTNREVEILEQLSKGLNYGEIATNLFISQGTVRKHVENTYRKLQVHNKMEAVTLAKKERII